ncbi:MAG: SPFH domain-containing protein [Clostridia bacterium]|nr:SPFH domain-containing protein [Clostridia bacterium]
MGLIRAAAGAIGSTLQDQWKEAIRCEEMGNDILMVKKTTPTGVISNKSVVIVGPGQGAIIYDNGRIVDATAEEGFYTFDTSSTPSLFAGQFGEMFKEMWQRFTFNGATAKEQAVYFFNTKEIIGNKFGTPNPVPYKDWGHPIMNARTNSYLAMSVKVKCFGTYTFQIADPFVFMSKIAGLSEVYKKEDLTEQIRAEVIGSFVNVMNSLGSDQYKIEVLELPNKTDEIKQIMDTAVFDQPIRDRGLKIVSFIVESLTLDDESNEKINKYEIGGDAYQQQGTLVGSYANAIEDAANNPNGTMNGFMGVGMMGMASGGAFGNATAGAFGGAAPMQPNPQAAAAAQTPSAPGPARMGWDTPVAAAPNAPGAAKMAWDKPAQTTPAPENLGGKICPNCGAQVAGNFCGECGTKYEAPVVPQKRVCPKCGTEAIGKFCTNCGTQID